MASNLFKDIFSIKEPIWIFNSGMSKGKFHDRQDLGFILRKGKTLKVRQVNNNFKGNLTLRLLGNDSKFSKEYTVKSGWVTAQCEESYVPFIDTPYGSVNAKIEYMLEDFDNDTIPLPIYTYNSNENTFFNVWEKNNSPFALIKDEIFQLLIPLRDIDITKKLRYFKSLDKLIEHYRELFKFYNNIAGIDNSSELNMNGKNRYFLMADKHGAGVAYYCNNWTANSEYSIDMWLENINWGQCHEIGHGYQAGFDNRGMYTGEVSNNLFGLQYEYSRLGKKADELGWLFNFGKKKAVEDSLYNKIIVDKGNYNTVDLREKLILYAMLKQMAGDEAHTKMYQGYRVLANKKNFKADNYKLPDLINEYYSNYSKFDFTPVLQRLDLKLENKIQPILNRIRGYEPVAYLADVVPKEELEKARNLLDPNILINCNFEMVKNEDIAQLSLKQNLKINLLVDNIDNFKGGNIILQNGNKTIDMKNINSNTVEFNNINTGIYTVIVDSLSMKNYSLIDNYVYVKEVNNEEDITLEHLKVSNLCNQKIKFLGLSDAQFAELSTDRNKGVYNFSITSKNPHIYFKGETYAAITIKDKNNNLKYENIMEGTDVKLVKEEIILDIGDKIEIYHREPSRLISDQKIVDKYLIFNNLTVDKYGLKNIAINNNTQKDLINRITESANLLIQNTELANIPISYLDIKKNLNLAIEILSTSNKNRYLKKYKNLLS